MNFRQLSVLIAFCICSMVATAQEAVKPAAEILQEAQQHAAKENKKVFIIFHASWCGWCHKMDSAMNDISCKPLFGRNFIIRHLVISESPGNKHLENPGAMDLLQQYHGQDKGIPFWLIFDKDGKLLSDSQMRPEVGGLDAPGENAGCPATAEEIAFFICVLKKTSDLTTAELGVISKSFSK